MESTSAAVQPRVYRNMDVVDHNLNWDAVDQGRQAFNQCLTSSKIRCSLMLGSHLFKVLSVVLWCWPAVPSGSPRATEVWEAGLNKAASSFCLPWNAVFLFNDKI